jgi:hypothetical protein
MNPFIDSAQMLQTGGTPFKMPQPPQPVPVEQRVESLEKQVETLRQQVDSLTRYHNSVAIKLAAVARHPALSVPKLPEVPLYGLTAGKALALAPEWVDALAGYEHWLYWNEGVAALLAHRKKMEEERQLVMQRAIEDVRSRGWQQSHTASEQQIAEHLLGTQFQDLLGHNIAVHPYPKVDDCDINALAPRGTQHHPCGCVPYADVVDPSCRVVQLKHAQQEALIKAAVEDPRYRVQQLADVLVDSMRNTKVAIRKRMQSAACQQAYLGANKA